MTRDTLRVHKAARDILERLERRVHEVDANDGISVGLTNQHEFAMLQLKVQHSQEESITKILIAHMLDFINSIPMSSALDLSLSSSNELVYGPKTSRY